MAMAMEGFSIRGYASRMRSIDVVKCWPFDGANEEVVRASLPPITIKKFSWWFDKLQLVQDDEGESDLDSESLQSLRMKRSGRGKSMRKTKAKAKAKAPKKRSIVELFAVAPQVERANSDDDDENGEYSDYEEEDSNDCSDEEDRIPNPKLSAFGKVSLNCKSKRKVKKGILSMSKKEKIVMIKDLKKDKVTKQQKGKKIAVDLRTKKKGKTSKLKQRTSAEIMTSSNCATYSKDLFDAFSTHSKKPRLKRVTSERTKCKISSTSKIFPHDQEAVFTVRGILKNQNKIVPAENCSDSNLQDASKLSHSNTQHVDKHVTFTGKDDVLEPRWKACPSVELELCNNLFSDVNHASLAKGHTEEMGKILSINEMNEIEEERSKSIKDKFEVQQQVTQKQFSSRHHVSDASNFVLRQHGFSQANFFGKTVPFGQGPLQSDSHNRVAVHDALYTCSSEIPTMSQEPYIPKLMIPMFNHASDAFNHSQRLLDHSGDAGPKHDSDCSMDFLKAYPQSPTSFLSIVHNNSNGRPVFPSQNIRENDCEHALTSQWIPHLSPKELMRTICSLPDWNSRASMFGGVSMNDDFVGLPLNSHGEFISVDSSGKDGFNHVMGISAVPHPSLGSVVHNNVVNNPIVNQIDVTSQNEMNSCKNQHTTCRINDNGKMIECCASPSRIGTIEQFGIGRRNTVLQAFDPYSYPMESDVDGMKVSHIDCRPHNRVQEHPGGEMIRQHGDPDHIQLHVTRSTMRLMGKEFTIGGKDLEGCENREVWTDKQIIAEHSGESGTKSPSIKCQDFPRFVVHPILGKLTETVADFSKAKINQAAASVPQMMVSESKISSQFFDCHSTVINQNAGTEIKEILIPEIYPHLSLASSALPNSHKSGLQESFSCAHVSPSESSRISIPASTLLNSSWNVSRSRNISEHKHNPLHGTQFAFKFPFSDIERGRHIHPYWSHNSFKAVSPYLSDSRQKGTSMDYGHPCSASGSVCYPCSLSGANYGIGSSVFSGPEPFNFSGHSSSQTTFTSASLAPHPSLPRKKKLFDNQSKSRFSVRIPNHGKISKKRLPSASNDSKKSSKIPKIGVHDDCSKTVAEFETGNNFESDSSKEALEPSSAQDNAGVMECGQSLVHEDNLEHSTAMNSFKLVGTPRSGPLKLTAGARYILKPCQENDQANSEPTNSTIPFVAPTCDRRAVDSEKSSEVYMF